MRCATTRWPASVRASRVALGALDLMRRIHADFEFKTASTDVDTPLIEAFEQRAGVCQDFAHLMIAALRMLGLAARYVSGYLLTIPPPGQEALLGADASHAWVQVYCPDTPGLPGRLAGAGPDQRPGARHQPCAPGAGPRLRRRDAAARRHPRRRPAHPGTSA